MKQENINDIKQKIEVLKSSDMKDPKKLQVLCLLLMKGMGYDKESLKNGRIEELFGHTEDFEYRREIGKIRDEYLPENATFDLSRHEILEDIAFLPIEQQRSCAENALHRLKLVIKFAHNDSKLKDILKNAETLKDKWEKV